MSPFNLFKISRWTWFFTGGCYLKEILILNSFSFEDKDPRFYKAKTRLLSKGLFIKGQCIYQRISPPTNLAAVLRDLPSSLQSLPSQKLNSQERSQPIQLLQLFKQLLLILGTSNIFLASTFSSFEMRLFIACK